MKKMITAFILFTSMALNAFAVEVRNCPTDLTVSYADFKENITFRELQKRVDEFGDMNEELLKSIKNAWDNVLDLGQIKQSAKLSSARSGRCVYGNEEGKKTGEIYTKSGKSILMTQTNVGPRGILLRVYAEVFELSKEEVKMSSKKPGIALAIPRFPYTDYSAGGDLQFIGNVMKASVDTESK